MCFKEEWAAIRGALGCTSDESVAHAVVRVKADPKAAPLARAVAEAMWRSVPGEDAGKLVTRAARVALGRAE